LYINYLNFDVIKISRDLMTKHIFISALIFQIIKSPKE